MLWLDPTLNLVQWWVVILLIIQVKPYIVSLLSCPILYSDIEAYITTLAVG